MLVVALISFSARALVKKTQESGITLQKADFPRNDTWTSPQTNAEESPKITLVAFLIQDGRHHVTPFLRKNRGIPYFFTFAVQKNI